MGAEYDAAMAKRKADWDAEIDAQNQMNALAARQVQIQLQLTASQDKQNQLAWDQLSAIAGQAQKMAYKRPITARLRRLTLPPIRRM